MTGAPTPATAPASGPAANSAARRLGRRIAIIVFGTIVSGTTAIWTAQIISQVWWPPYRESGVDCRTGVLDLVKAVSRARLAAARETGDERAALARFRAALEPEWTTRRGVETNCKDDAEALASLRDLDALRYAEEHAVRYEAVGLASLRRRVDSIAKSLQPAGSERSPSPSPPK